MIASTEGILLDPSLRFDDGLGQDARPADLWRAGIGREQLRIAIRNLYENRTGIEACGYRALDCTDVHIQVIESICALLDKGKDWIIEPLQKLQPRSYAILAEPESKLLGGFQATYMEPPGLSGNIPFPLAVLIVRDRAIKIEEYYTGWSPEAVGTDDRFERGAFPEILLKTWWYRIAGLKLMRSIPPPVGDPAQPLLQWPGCGTGINHILAGLGVAAKRKYMPLYKERFGADAVIKVYATGRVALLCILDTRPPETRHAPVGDQLFVHMARNDKVIYHVHGGRFDELRVLAPEQLAEVFDRYFAHVLGRVPGEFDFLPYSRVL